MSLVVNNLTKRFTLRGTPAVADVSFAAPTGGITTLLGPSGSGKSTVLRMVAGLEQPDSGTVQFGERDFTTVPAQRRGIGFVFQSYALFKHMNVRKNIAFGLRVRKTAPEEVRARVDELLSLVQLDGLGERYPGQLSGGQRQRVAFARALAIAPQLLLLDEPFGALDAQVRLELREWLRRFHDQRHVTTLLVTHDQEEAMEVSDHVVVMHEGRVAQVGQPQEVYDRPATPFVASFVGGANVLRGHMRDGRASVGSRIVRRLGARRHPGARRDGRQRLRAPARRHADQGADLRRHARGRGGARRAAHLAGRLRQGGAEAVGRRPDDRRDVEDRDRRAGDPRGRSGDGQPARGQGVRRGLLDLTRIHASITDTVGRTPLVELARITAACRPAITARLLGKVESRNPCGSVKDRIGIAMVEDAERRGLLEPGATLIEPTTGNTGVALAFVAASRGYKLMVTMPERMSKERVALLRYLGAEVVMTPGTLMRDAVARAAELVKEIPRAVMLEQFKNPANPEAHRRTTGPEIWEDTGGAVDMFVAGVGTGGTITGVGEVLKLKKPGVRVIAVEPAKAAVLSGARPGNHMIQGIGAGFVPQVLNRAVLDEVVAVTEDDAMAAARRLAREEGILAGISSGAALAAALQVARRPESAGKVIVVMLPDTGERYVSTPLFSEMVAS